MMKKFAQALCLIGALLAGWAVQGAKKPANDDRVADLYVVDCLLPSMVRRIGNTNYTTPRRPIRTTAADCRRRAGEYTNYNDASMNSALEVWLPAAEQGDVEAQTTVGEIYERGLGGTPDYKVAAHWYELAAKAGNSRAQFNLGSLYQQGLGVEANRVTALSWYRKAWGATAGDEENQVRQQLEESLAQRDARIQQLEARLARLQQTARTAAADETRLEQEIADLRLWIGALESERDQVAAVTDDGAPRLREPVQTPSNSRSSGPAVNIKAGSVDFGRYHALIIGNQNYSNIESLATPRQDAEDMAELLEKKYGFNVHLLLDADNIAVMEAVNDLNQELGENDNLLIYYAGHGMRVQTGNFESGYWLPTNADAPPRNTYWVSNEFVTGHLSSIQARRILVVADSCYAGLLSDAPGYILLQGGPDYTEDFLRYKLQKRSRLLLASGGDKPVLDNGAPQHSVFAAVLLKTLRDNDQILSGPQLFTAIDDEVRRRSTASGYAQAAEYKVIKGAGHEVGDFFFVPI
jgi:hypothetical protein